MSPRETRTIRNEELFREVNAHIAELEERSRGLYSEELLPLVCECSHTGCVTPIEVDPATFGRVRENALRFIVAPGHEDIEIESRVEKRPGYLVVEKQPDG
jgi:hypothetical protein